MTGWIFGFDGKADVFWSPHAKVPCFMVPQEDLFPFNA